MGMNGDFELFALSASPLGTAVAKDANIPWAPVELPTIGRLLEPEPFVGDANATVGRVDFEVSAFSASPLGVEVVKDAKIPWPSGISWEHSSIPRLLLLVSSNGDAHEVRV